MSVYVFLFLSVYVLYCIARRGVWFCECSKPLLYCIVLYCIVLLGGAFGSVNVAACMKHFIGYSNPRFGQDVTPNWIPGIVLYCIVLYCIVLG